MRWSFVCSLACHISTLFKTFSFTISLTKTAPPMMKKHSRYWIIYPVVLIMPKKCQALDVEVDPFSLSNCQQTFYGNFKKRAYAFPSVFRTTALWKPCHIVWIKTGVISREVVWLFEGGKGQDRPVTVPRYFRWSYRPFFNNVTTFPWKENFKV